MHVWVRSLNGLAHRSCMLDKRACIHACLVYVLLCEETACGKLPAPEIWEPHTTCACMRLYMQKEKRKSFSSRLYACRLIFVLTCVCRHTILWCGMRSAVAGVRSVSITGCCANRPSSQTQNRCVHACVSIWKPVQCTIPHTERAPPYRGAVPPTLLYLWEGMHSQSQPCTRHTHGHARVPRSCTRSR